MQQAFLSWFPSAAYANLYGLAVLLALLSDEVIPRLAGGKGTSLGAGSDRGSFLVIYIASFAGLLGGLYLRYRGIGLVPFWVQILALFSPWRALHCVSGQSSCGGDSFRGR